jgi:protein ImuA
MKIPPPALREAVRRLERPAARPAGGAVAVAPAIDAWLPGWNGEAGGIACGAVHEVLAADPGAASGFVAMLAGRASAQASGAPVLWLSPARAAKPYPPGLAAFGLPPAALVVVQAEAEELLWAAEEALRSTAPAAVIVLGTAPTLTAWRRLQLAAEGSGGLGLMLGPDQAVLRPSAAYTRWRVAAAPGAAGPVHALAPPRWRLDLLRARGGRPASWLADWNGTALSMLERQAA